MNPENNARLAVETAAFRGSVCAGPVQRSRARRPGPALRAAALCAALLLPAGAASAQSRTDVITLLNGDRFTGEIRKLDRGRLEVKTDDVGTIAVEWDKVASVSAARQFEVVSSDGRRHLGSLRPAATGSIAVEGAGGDLLFLVEEITGIAPIGRSFWARLDGSFDAGFTYTQSSGVAQATLNSSTRFRRPASEFRLSASATVTRQPDATQEDDRATAELSYVRFRGRRWLVGGATRLDTNDSLGLVLRSQVGASLGMRPVNTNRAQAMIGAGLMVNHERGRDTEPTQNVEGLLVARLSYYTYDRPSTSVDLVGQYYPSLSERGRQRVEANVSLTRELWRSFFVGLQVYESFDSRPPSADAVRNDVGVVASVGWSY